MKQSKIEIRKGRGGKFRFVVIAANGEPLATSEIYESKANCKKGVDAIIGAFNGHVGDPVVVDTALVASPVRRPRQAARRTRRPHERA
jgi:uncharacterized protein YegP (UPF0339 family)